MLAIKETELKAFTVRLTEETYELLQQDAQRIGTAPAVIARAYIKMCVERRTDVMRLLEQISHQPSLDAALMSELEK